MHQHVSSMGCSPALELGQLPPNEAAGVDHAHVAATVALQRCAVAARAVKADPALVAHLIIAALAVYGRHVALFDRSILDAAS